jgi:pimeloyl-ACP methyl ester carboxylesterase
MNEEAITFGIRRSLVGIVTAPPAEAASHLRHGVILLNPGLVHRVGPGRIYVKIARILAERGLVVLRFDFSGIGDSTVRQDQMPFEKSAVEEVREAIDFLQRTRGIEYVTLLGGCSGAVISLRAAACDLRVRQAVLINFPAAEDDGAEAGGKRFNRAKAHYYWSFALFRSASWRKLISGKADYRQIIHALGSQVRGRISLGKKSHAHNPQFASEVSSLAGRGVSLAFVCSAGDPAVDDLRQAGGDQFKRLCALGTVALDVIPRSDHTFSSLADQEKLLKIVVARIESMALKEKRFAGPGALPRLQGAVVPAIRIR